jgi:hypothetical protein
MLINLKKHYTISSCLVLWISVIVSYMYVLTRSCIIMDGYATKVESLHIVILHLSKIACTEKTPNIRISGIGV